MLKSVINVMNTIKNVINTTENTVNTGTCGNAKTPPTATLLAPLRGAAVLPFYPFSTSQMENNDTTPPAHTKGTWIPYCHEDGSWCVHAVWDENGIGFDAEVAHMVPLGGEETANAGLMASAPALLREGQALRDAVSHYLLGVPDAELPEYLTTAFDRWELITDSTHEHAA